MKHTSISDTLLLVLDFLRNLLRQRALRKSLRFWDREFASALRMVDSRCTQVAQEHCDRILQLLK